MACNGLDDLQRSLPNQTILQSYELSLAFSAQELSGCDPGYYTLHKKTLISSEFFLTDVPALMALTHCLSRVPQSNNDGHRMKEVTSPGHFSAWIPGSCDSADSISDMEKIC